MYFAIEQNTNKRIGIGACTVPEVLLACVNPLLLSLVRLSPLGLRRRVCIVSRRMVAGRFTLCSL